MDRLDGFTENKGDRCMQKDKLTEKRRKRRLKQKIEKRHHGHLRKTPDKKAEATVWMYISRAGRKGISIPEIKRKYHLNGQAAEDMKLVLAALQRQGKVICIDGRYSLAGRSKRDTATIVRTARTFCFAQREGEDQDIFIPGRYAMGAMAGDIVSIHPLPRRGESEEAQVTAVLQYGPSRFTGTLVGQGNRYFVDPDLLSRDLIPVLGDALGGAQAGDKVLAEVISRGVRHKDHVCRVVDAFGDAWRAASCAQAYLEVNQIRKDFPDDVLAEAREAAMQKIPAEELQGRLDLREEILFTIDGADSKDLDDAVSIARTSDGWKLGVHIADVSYYVREGTLLDQEALARGTSIYYADQVIPMLPPDLSNGICSLNPGEDRLSFSALLDLDRQGHLVGYRFCKSVIRSRVKGVYQEINQIFDQTAGEDILQKYAGLTDTLYLMRELAALLSTNKKQRGAPQIVTTESKISVSREGIADAVYPRKQGVAESMIEEFMLTANEAAASFALEHGIPFVYRVHEPPSPEKLADLKELLGRLGIPAGKLAPGVSPGVLANILKQAENTPLFPIINRQVLRSMAKAKYSVDPIGHYGLALKNYAQFTSPIRRYPDLAIHRVLSALLRGQKADSLQKKYGAYTREAARSSTAAELSAIAAERICEDFYKAEYMSAHIGEVFEGIISSVTPQGLYVELTNTVEGLVRIETLPVGQYEYDGFMELKETLSGQAYRIGDPVSVRCTAANVSTGNLDFELEGAAQTT